MLSKYVDRSVLNIYKLYVRPHLDYGDGIYHNQRADMMNCIEQVQYKPNCYKELWWKSLSDRRWFRRLNLYYKISTGLSPPYLTDYIPRRSVTNISLRTRNQNIVCMTERYEKSFFPFCIKNWNSLDESTRSLLSISRFKTHLLNCPGDIFWNSG